VDELVPDAHVIERAETVLKKVIANAPLSLKYSLEAVNKGLETSVAEGLLIEASLFAVCASTDDKKEGTSAFLEKRTPTFQGK
jgi:enoyl-CoA hydratase